MINARGVWRSAITNPVFVTASRTIAAQKTAPSGTFLESNFFFHARFQIRMLTAKAGKFHNHANF